MRKLIKHKNQDLKKSPFSIKANPVVVGHEKEKKLLVEYIKNGDICFLTGYTGTGKSSLLLWLSKNLKFYNIFYIDAANIENGFSIKEFLKSQRRGFDRFREYPSNCIILLDESQDCGLELQKALKLHWDHDHIKSIVISQIDQNLNDFSISFRDRIGKRVIKLGKINDTEAIKLINSRIGQNFFEKKFLKEIIKKANYIPRRILENCELVCLRKRENDKLKLLDIKKILTEKHTFNKNRRISKSGIKKKIENLKDTVQENTLVADRKRLTLVQKKVLLNFKKGFKTAGEIGKNLEIPILTVEDELKKLYDEGLIQENDNQSRK